jgi:hypothetical protein
MSPTSQPAASANSPLLRVTQRSRPVAVAPSTTQFEWYLCPQVSAFSHLVLIENQQQFGHWVLPAVGSQPAEPPTGLWMQVTPAVGLPRPLAHQASCQGTGTVISCADPAAALTSEGLVLHLPAAEGLRWVYWLRPLRPGSPSWLLSRERPHSRSY